MTVSSPTADVSGTSEEDAEETTGGLVDRIEALDRANRAADGEAMLAARGVIDPGDRD